MSVGTSPVTVEIAAENSAAPAPDMLLAGTGVRVRATVTPSAAGRIQWQSVRPELLTFRSTANSQVIEATAANGVTQPTARTVLCALFTPEAADQPVAMAVLPLWVIVDPEQRGPYRVGRASYTEPSFTIPAGLEAWPNDVEVTVEALVRYPARADGDNQPFADDRPRYPLVVLAHGRHAAIEFERNPDGSLRPDGAGDPVPLLTGAGTIAEFKNHEGLEYLASHLASYGFVALSVNLNGRFESPDADPANVRADLVEPRGRRVTCRPFLVDETAIEHRALTLLRHVLEMQAKDLSDPLFKDRLDFENVGLVGHSRGGDAVVAAHATNQLLPDAMQVQIKALVSIAPTDFRNHDPSLPYLVLIGSADDDVADAHGLRLYDRASRPRQLVWIVGAIHNYFCSVWHWQDEVSAAPIVGRPQHESAASGYAVLFLLSQLRQVRDVEPYFTGARPLAALAGVEVHHAFQALGPMVVDAFEDTPPDRARNALALGVGAANLAAFDEQPFDRLTDACTVNVGSWFHDTRGLLVEWSSPSATYATSLGDVSVAGYNVLSFRVAQNDTGNPSGGQDFKVRLTDSAGASAVLQVRDFATIPAAAPKSVLKTVRLPLNRFKQANAALNLASVRTLTFEFNVNGSGKLGFDDIEFSA
jgi:dienelactone hydrolase